MDKKTIWKTIIQTLVTILTAIGTTLGVTSCMGLAGRYQLHGAVNEARSPRQHKHEIKHPLPQRRMRGG